MKNKLVPFVVVVFTAIQWIEEEEEEEEGEEEERVKDR